MNPAARVQRHADFDRCGFGWKPVQKPYPPIYFSGLNDPARSASRISKYNLSGWIGIQDTPESSSSGAVPSSKSSASSGARARSTISISAA